MCSTLSTLFEYRTIVFYPMALELVDNSGYVRFYCTYILQIVEAFTQLNVLTISFVSNKLLNPFYLVYIYSQLGGYSPFSPPDMPLAGFKIQIPKCNSLNK